jgi:hypothetical protein
MTSRERRAYFERLYGMREAYAHLGALDRTGITPMAEVMAAAEQELERIMREAESRPPADVAGSPHGPV